MNKFFDDYFNIKIMIQSKKEYRTHMKRVEQLPADQQCVLKKIQAYMWQFVSGSGYDMLEIQWGYLNYLKKGSSTKISFRNNWR